MSRRAHYDRALGVRLGRLQRAGDLRLDSPEVQRQLRQRFGPWAIPKGDAVLVGAAIPAGPGAAARFERLVAILRRSGLRLGRSRGGSGAASPCAGL